MLLELSNSFTSVFQNLVPRLVLWLLAILFLAAILGVSGWLLLFGWLLGHSNWGSRCIYWLFLLTLSSWASARTSAGGSHIVRFELTIGVRYDIKLNHPTIDLKM
jgi:TRAP-type C4-dicarboxylate transport system permease small subunit